MPTLASKRRARRALTRSGSVDSSAAISRASAVPRHKRSLLGIPQGTKASRALQALHSRRATSSAASIQKNLGQSLDSASHLASWMIDMHQYQKQSTQIHKDKSGGNFENGESMFGSNDNYKIGNIACLSVYHEDGEGEEQPTDGFNNYLFGSVNPVQSIDTGSTAQRSWETSSVITIQGPSTSPLSLGPDLSDRVSDSSQLVEGDKISVDHLRDEYCEPFGHEARPVTVVPTDTLYDPWIENGSVE
jgi:hypothetical protein